MPPIAKKIVLFTNEIDGAAVGRIDGAGIGTAVGTTDGTPKLIKAPLQHCSTMSA